MATITILGTGNVGQHLAKALHSAGHHIVQIYNRTPAHWQELMSFLPKTTQFTTHLAQLLPHTGLYLIAVADDAVAAVSQTMPAVPGVVAHTSGATPMSTLAKHPRRGIFYPLQTFTAAHTVHFEQVPFCIDALLPADAAFLQNIARTLSPRVYAITDEQRRILHVAAVFANNFTNHLLAIADDICQTNGVPFEILKPLIAETLKKTEQQPPRNVQTGPAKRADVHTITQHLQLLETQPQYRHLYRILSESIAKMYHGNLKLPFPE
ncbi:DUF2520 domain-containing protein [Sphingobacteriales bacterium UPWRP_1]|nr:hypothetical protein BVG80_12075 [Sphingobacteriales bacterium TSM_CSM]PSJ72232.1 DUF2520 domain-containing protein [Sphingobacteriales bacterium UPWRP_1]